MQEARADIIFINMNGSVTEIPAAQQAAAQMGERVYVLPKKVTPDYKVYQLTDELIELAQQGVRPRAMIISGHHTRDQGYWGLLDGVKVEASIYYISTILKQKGLMETSPAVRDFFTGLQSVYLWGCYTGTLENVHRFLSGKSAAFPNTRFLVGFADKAPLSTTKVSGEALKSALLKETQFRAGSPEQMMALLSTLPGAERLDYIIHKYDAFITKDGASKQQNFIDDCRLPERKESLRRAIGLIWNYYWNQIGPIPEDTSHGPLRQAYRELQRGNFCLRMGAVKITDFEIPSLPNTVRLIFYKNVIGNFARFHAADLQIAQQELQTNGITDVAYLSQLDQIERGILMKKLEQTHEQIKALYARQTDPEKKALNIYLNSMIDDIEEVVYPNEEFIPLTWIDATSQQTTSFIVLGNFKAAKTAARKKAGAVTP